MKSIHPTLAAHLAQEVTTTCLLVRIECVGNFAGYRYGFTNLDEDVGYDAGDAVGFMQYNSEYGFVPLRLSKTSGMNVDESEFDGAITDDLTAGFDEAMIRAGLFRSAIVTVFRVNYEDVDSNVSLRILNANRHEIVDYGRAGQTVFDEIGWRTEFRSLLNLLKQPTQRVTSLTCDAQFGDARCGKAFSWQSGSVDSVVDSVRSFSDPSLGHADDYYYPGVLKWTSGPNFGHEFDVESYVGNVVTLFPDTPYPISPDDTYDIRQDCNKRDRLRNGVPGDCKDKHNNLGRFRGQPFIPVDGTAMVPGAEIRKA